MKKQFKNLVTALIIGAVLLSPSQVRAAEDSTAETTGDFINLGEIMETSEQEQEEVVLPDIQSVDEAKNGVVQVNYVYIDDDENEHIVTGGTGFLVGDKEKDEYVLTSSHILSLDEDTKKAAYNYLGIKKDKDGEYKNVKMEVQVVAENDVTISADIITTSTELDVAVLRLSQPIYTRTPLTIYTSIDGKANELPYEVTQKVYALGLPDTIIFKENESYYSNDRVVMSSGDIVNMTTINDVQTIQHTAEIGTNNCGGPLVDESGRVIGVNTLYTEDKYYSAVDSTVIVRLLDALGIEYSKETPSEAVIEASTEASIEEEQELPPQPSGLPVGLLIVAIVLIAVLVILLVIVLIMVARKNGPQKKEKKQKEDKNKNASIPPFNPSAINGATHQNAAVGGNSMGTSVLSGEMANGTTVLGATPNVPKSRISGTLIRKKDKKQILIDKSEFSIGKDSLHVNYCISDNGAVSRLHSMIRSNDNGAYIEDCNSTNGTFVNGRRIVAGQPIKLSDGDVIMFADDEYEYRI